MEDIIEHIRMLGLTPRQQRLLDLEAIYEGTYYDALKPWNPGVEMVNGFLQRVPCDERAPSVQVGAVTEKVDKLLDKLVAQGKMPQISGISDRLETILTEEINLEESLYLPTLDLVVKGSGCLGFVRPDGKTFEPLQLDPVWCEPVLVMHAGGARAAQIAEELERLGVRLPTPQPGNYLFVPEGAWRDDVVFLRHEFVWEEELSSSYSGVPGTTVRWRRRRDYLPTMILEYEDVRVLSEDAREVRWELSSPPRPHNWGTVNAVWVRARGARPEDVDGPSFIRPALQKLDKAADLAASRLDDSVASIAWPQLIERDVKDVVAEANEANGYYDQNTQSPLSSEVRRYRSMDSTKPGEVKILEVSGEGAKVGREHVAELMKHVDRLTGIRDIDPQLAAGTLSGVAIERMMETTIARVNAYRGRVSELIRYLAWKIGRVIGEDASGIRIDWPPIVSPTAVELGELGEKLMRAAGGPVVSVETAAKIFAGAAGLEDVNAEVEALNRESEVRLAAVRRTMSEAPDSDSDSDDDADEETAPTPAGE